MIFALRCRWKVRIFVTLVHWSSFKKVSFGSSTTNENEKRLGTTHVGSFVTSLFLFCILRLRILWNGVAVEDISGGTKRTGHIFQFKSGLPFNVTFDLIPYMEGEVNQL